MIVAHPTPALWATKVTEAARRRSVFQRAHLATPGCLTCGGRGWNMMRVALPMIGGVEAVACPCTLEVCHG